MNCSKEDIRDELQVRDDYSEFLHIGLVDKTNEELESMLNTKRRLWARIGMSLEVTEDEYQEICTLIKNTPEKRRIGYMKNSQALDHLMVIVICLKM